MAHLQACLIKAAASFAILAVILGSYYQLSLINVILISLFLSVGGYLLGDLLILSKLGSSAATFADFGFTYLGVLILCGIFAEIGAPMGILTFFAAIALTTFEGFFHLYMQRKILKNNKMGHLFVFPRINFATEFAEEMVLDEKSDLIKKEKDENK